MTMKNRLWRAAAWEKKADDKGHMTQALEKIYLDLAEGGVGTIITGYAFVREEEQPNPNMMGIYDDSFIPEYQDLTKKVHERGANIVMQIVYGGSQTDFRPEGRLIWGPSAVADVNYGVVPTPMTVEDIQSLVASFAEAALRVKKSGFDGVELHGAHGYLLSQFLMPYYNRRTDQYGGSLENRARIIYETVQAIRKEVGQDYPVLIKLDGTDNWGENGLTSEECIEVAKGLEASGITAIEISGGHRAEPLRQKLIQEQSQSYFRHEAAAVATAVNVPVILVGGNRSVTVMKEVLENTDIEYFSMARTLHSEPDLPQKWEKGYQGRPRCVSCNQCWHEESNTCVLDRSV